MSIQQSAVVYIAVPNRTQRIMKTLVIIVITLVVGLHIAYGQLRLKKICETDDPAGTNSSVAANAGNYLDCARACELDFRCNYISYHDNECVIDSGEPVCGTIGGGVSRDVYKVDPGCAPGWYRYSGSCYWVGQNESYYSVLDATCGSLDASVVAISSAVEGTFLTQLLDHSDVANTTAWLGVGLSGSGLFWWNGEPWGYLNWADGQPAFVAGGKVTFNSVDAKWQIQDGSLRRIGVCEKALADA